MSSGFTFVIPGDPHPQARHRTFMRGGYAIEYDPDKKFKEEISRKLYKMTIGYNPFLYNKYEVNFLFEMQMPKSFSKSEVNLALWGIIIPTQGDFDNFIKHICDAANKILWDDDRNIYVGKYEKRFSLTPQTTVTIMPKKIDLKCKASKILSIYSPESVLDLIEQIHLLEEMQDDDEIGIANALEAIALNHSALLKKVFDAIKKCE